VVGPEIDDLEANTVSKLREFAAKQRNTSTKNNGERAAKH
jgi:hypothetical protein